MGFISCCSFFHSFIISSSLTKDDKKDIRRIVWDSLGSKVVREQENVVQMEEREGEN